MTVPRIGRRSLLTAAGLGLLGWASTGCATDQRVTRVATYLPESYDDLCPGVQILTGRIDSGSGGALVCDTYPSGTLLGAEQLIPGLLLGVADVVVQTSSYVSSTFPVLGAMERPFGTDDFARRRRALDPAGPLYELINTELAAQNVRLLGGMPCTFEYLWTVDRPILTPEDARGLRIRVAGEIEGETVKALGAAPVFIGSAEVFEALERGTIDGLMSYVGTVYSRDLQEIVRYGTLARFGAYTVDAYCRADWPPRRSSSDPRRRGRRAGGRPAAGADRAADADLRGATWPTSSAASRPTCSSSSPCSAS